MILDVGCGKCNRGDVGVDIQRNSYADVICDINHLPFKNDSFHEVLASHVIEHMTNPELALKEWCRVASHHVHLFVPWRNGWIFTKNKGKNSKNPYMRHRWSFNKSWFSKFTEKYGFGVHMRYSESFILPTEIEVYVFRVDNKYDKSIA